jgi:hypothetical protein
MLPTKDRLLRHREVSPSGCWLWTGAVQPNGYAMTTVGSRAGGAKRQKAYVHRLAYEEWVGPIPGGKELDHLCRVRRCFNPEHLEPVTRRENTLRGDGPELLGAINGDKTHCKWGHPFDKQNTRPRPGGGRTCLACERARLGPPKRFKDRCPKGHAFTPENTGRTGHRGHRYCKTCNRAKARQHGSTT